MPHFLRRILPGVALAMAVGVAGCKNDNPTAPTKPDTPTSLTAASNSPTRVKLEWKGSANAAGYVVQRSVGAGEFVAIAAPPETTYTDATVRPGESYHYRVAATAGSLYSDFTAVLDVTTPLVGPKERVLTGDITANQTLRPDTLYILSGYVKVRSGVTLSVLPGTVVVGDTLVPGSSLWILRGAKLDAQGTADRPIVFTSARAPGSRAPGDWGGIVVIGKGLVNRSVGGGATTLNTEGPAAPAENYAAGTDSTDNSGALRYVRIEFAGYAETPDQEINALSLYAVGRGTQYQYVEAMSSLDDAFELFGGGVQMRFVVSYEAGDDHFDWTDGYNGKAQFMIGFQSWQPTPRAGTGFLSTDPRGFEGDGCEAGTAGCTSYAVASYSMPVFANFTLVGPGSGVALGGVSDNNGVVLRRGTGGTFLNGVVARWQGIGWNVRDQATDAMRALDSLSALGVYLADNGGGNFDAADACTTTGTGGSCGTAAKYPGVTGLAQSAASLFVGLPASGSTPTAAAFDWTPAAGSPIATGGVTSASARVQARLVNFFGGNPMPLTSYAGAVPPGGPQWWVGWTNYARN